MKKAKIAIVVACALWSLSVSVFAATDFTARWGYDAQSNQGPAHSGDHYSACQSGGFQSPINIHSADITGDVASPMSLNFPKLTGRLSDDGHSVMLHPVARFVTVGKTSYSPIQFHFHSLAETQLNGHQSAAEIHFVTKNDKDQYLVLAVFVEPGASNKALSRVIKNTKQDEMHFSSSEMEGLFPENLTYYTFEGSLTTPPCSRDVTWVVFTHPITASQTQIQQLQDEFQRGDKNYFRPTQAINHRPILVGRVLT